MTNDFAFGVNDRAAGIALSFVIGPRSGMSFVIARERA